MKKPQLCKCGCGGMTVGTPRYKNGTIFYPEYIRGHHPNCRANQTGQGPAWNKGLTKADHPSISRMGYQPGHEPYGNWDDVNERLRTDPEFKARWLESKRGQVAWNKGLTKKDYPNGIASGPEHGNWKSDASSIRELAEYKAIRLEILARDDYTCNHCHKRGGKLHVHHVVSFAEDETLALDPDNLIVLCVSCHKDIHFPNRTKSKGN